jgi:hypothetical protein
MVLKRFMKVGHMWEASQRNRKYIYATSLGYQNGILQLRCRPLLVYKNRLIFSLSKVDFFGRIILCLLDR